jgi:orotidine-5'-phosphate decarboxylase
MGINMEKQAKHGKDRLIVALDVPGHEQALNLVKQLDNVFFFKIGLELIVAGNVLELITELQRERSGEGGIFIDLKVTGDIGNTITRFVRACATHKIKFITLGGPAEFTIKSGVIQTAVEARGDSDYPKILGVPLLSSSRTDEITLQELGAANATQYILNRGEALIAEGCDGLIVSGDAIKDCKNRFNDAIVVSPGIRPSGTNSDEHERFTTPSKAIELGSDFLVVGRPILNAPNKREAAQNIIDEIDAALDRKPSPVST